jgi:epsilon-lactone hydrolase
MPSVQSHLFRVTARLASTYTDRQLAHSLDTLRRSALRGPRVPRGTEVEPVTADGVPCEWIRAAGQPPARVVLYLHGGGWVLGWGAMHRRMVAHLSALAGARCLAVDYRLAPEHPFPAALDDCVAAYRWLLKNGVAPERIAIAGDSAGGNLTVTTLLALRAAGEPLPAAAACLSPAADLSGSGRDLSTGHDIVLSHTTGQMMARSYLAGQDPRLPLISPVYADLGGLPPLLIQIGSDELLLEGAQRLADRARDAGVATTCEVWPGMWHVWHLMAPYLPEAQQALEHVGRFIGDHTG